MVESVRSPGCNRGEGSATERHKDHVRVGRENPPIARVGAADCDVACYRLQGLQMRSVGVSGMHTGTDAKNSQKALCPVGQRILYGLWKGREIVGCIIIYKDELVGSGGQQLCHAIQA